MSLSAEYVLQTRVAHLEAELASVLAAADNLGRVIDMLLMELDGQLKARRKLLRRMGWPEDRINRTVPASARDIMARPVIVATVTEGGEDASDHSPRSE